MKIWTPFVEKTIVAVSMALTGYSAILSVAPTLPAVPVVLTNPILGQVSIATTAAAFTLYGVYMLMTKY